MPRGRKPKAAYELTSYICSECDFKAAQLKACHNHILNKHLGQALINEPRRELGDSEKITGYNHYVRKFKVIKCSKCDKQFKSGGGYKYHIERCGVDPAKFLIECEICSSILQDGSFLSHMQSQHTRVEKPKSVEANDSLLDITDNSTGRRKRNSAKRALQQFKNMAKDMLYDEPSIPKKRQRIVDEEFEVKQEETFEDDVEEEEEEAEFEIEEEETDRDALFLDEDSDDSGEASEEESYASQTEDNDLIFMINGSLNDKSLKVITLSDLDEMFSFLKPFIKRVIENPTLRDLKSNFEYFELDEITCEEEHREFKCHREDCIEKFDYRLEMENHYRKCLSVTTENAFVFECNATDECQFRANFLNFQMCKHIFQDHLDVIKNSQDRYYTKWFQYFYRASPRKNTKKNKSKNLYVKSSIQPGMKKYVQHLSLNYLKKLINFKIKYFSCLTSKNWCHQLLGRLSKEAPPFKSTLSMSNGDNDYKLISSFQSLRVFDGCYTFNVGNRVTAAAWLPLPIQTGRVPFAAAFAEESKNAPNQFILLATSSFVDQFACLKTSNSLNILQLWDMGDLLPKGESSKQPQMAMNINHDYGIIKAIEWCPHGITHQDFLLGLVALGGDDGSIRIVAMPNPRTIKYSYDIAYSFVMPTPTVLLKHAHPNIILHCNAISWYKETPFDRIVAAFGEGYILSWNLNELATCQSKKCKHDDVLMSTQMFEDSKNNSIFDVKWLNTKMFVTVGVGSIKLWHEDYREFYQEWPRYSNFAHLAIHPMWYKTVIFSDAGSYKKSSLIYVKSFDEPEDRSHSIATFNNLAITGVSISPWMYVMAYSNDNGELHVTNSLPAPTYLDRRMKYFRLFGTKFGNLFPSSDDSKTEPKRNGKKLKAKNDQFETGKTRSNIVENEEIDMKNERSDFFMRHFIIFDDKEVQHKNTTYVTKSLTKNDPYQYQTVSHIAWCPNITSYSWIFTATNSGLCRLNNFVRISPDRLD